jgi:hypothetical protein
MDMSERLEVGLDVLCSLDRSKTDAFIALLRELISLVGATRVAGLKKVIVVSDSQVTNTVNAIIKTVEPSASYSPSNTYSAYAVAIPLESEGALACFIVVGEKYLEPLDAEHNHPIDTVSILLEELLHVWVYTSAWQRRGYVQHHNKGLSACEEDLLIIASLMCDEYAVIRRKSLLVSNLPLFEPEPGKGFVAGKLNYSGDVANDISQGIAEIEKIIIEAASGTKAVSDSWSDLTRTLYRGIFEPLSREAAYCDGTPEESMSHKKLLPIKFYRDVLADCWSKIHGGLNRIFDSNLDETEVILNEIVCSIQALLKTIGVAYRKTEDGRCWVDFKSSFFDT